MLIYRRSEAEMSAYDFEQKLAKTDGAEFLLHAAPLEVVADASGHVIGLKLVRSATRNGRLEMLTGTEWIEPCDMVIKAIGEQKQSALLKKLFPKLELDKRGVVVQNLDTKQTNLPKVFAGGDCANGGREVVNAVAEGKKAARGIHAFFGEGPVSGPIQPSRYGVKTPPTGSGFDKPIRVPELEAEYASKCARM
jgi:glutamate synthase (NADPH/NADH) small chain